MMKNNKLDIPFDITLPRNLKYNQENKKQYDSGKASPMLTQHVGVELVDEAGTTVQSSEINFNYVIAQVWELLDKVNAPLLKSIDIYGDSIFTNNQFLSLVSEITQLAEFVEDQGVLSDMAEFMRFISRAPQNTSLHLIGD